jgi:cellulose synthase/poly-beta-1,6-N-acetylglucosamine synthase-like glycosyltransferase
VPAFNHAPFLRQRIESIVAQDRPPSEIVILDDASTDAALRLRTAISSATVLRWGSRSTVRPEMVIVAYRHRGY